MPHCLGRVRITHSPYWASLAAVLCPGPAAELANRLCRNCDITEHPRFVRKRTKQLSTRSGADLELTSQAELKLTQVLLRCAPDPAPLGKEDLSSITATDFQWLCVSSRH